MGNCILYSDTTSDSLKVYMYMDMSMWAVERKQADHCDYQAIEL